MRTAAPRRLLGQGNAEEQGATVGSRRPAPAANVTWPFTTITPCPLPRSLPALFGCLLLLVSCAKTVPALLVPLEGRWALKSQTMFSYFPTGVLAATVGPLSIPGKYRTEITPDSIFYFMSVPSPESRTSTWAYTRHGTSLRVHHPTWSSTDNIEVTELSTHSLTLHFHAKHTANGWQDEIDTFTR